MTFRKPTISKSAAFSFLFSITLMALFLVCAVPVQAQQGASAEELQDELDRLRRGYHGMTMTFIQFAEEQQVDAYEAGRGADKFTQVFLIGRIKLNRGYASPLQTPA